MKLAYITTISLSGGDAQSIQVESMATVFVDALQQDFLLCSPISSNTPRTHTRYQWIPIVVSASLPRTLRYIFFILATVRHIYRYKPTHIYSRDIGVVAAYTLLGFRATYEMHKPFETRLGDWLFRFFASRIRVVAISEALSRYILTNYSVQDTRLFVAHDGVFLEKYTMLHKEECQKKLRQVYGIREEKPIILYSSNLYKGKGLEIVEAIAEKLNDVHVIIMGDSYSNFSHTKKQFPNLHYIGKKSFEEVPQYISGADILILPFTKELKTWQYHSALKMFEYMSARVPIVTSNIGSLKEIFSEKNSWLFSPDDMNSCISAIEAALSQKEYAEKKVQRAFDEVKHYTWQKRAQKILLFLNQ